MSHRLYFSRISIVAAAAAAVVAGSGCMSFKPKSKSKMNDQQWDQLAQAADDRPAAPKEQRRAAIEDEVAVQIPSDVAIQPVDSEDADAAALEALRRKSEAYAAALEAMIQQRGNSPSAGGDGAALPPRQSAVEWIDPNRFTVSLGDGGTAKSSSKRPAATAQPPQNPTVAKSTPATQPAGAAPIVEDQSNTPLALADVSDKQTVAMITPNPAMDASPPSPVEKATAAINDAPLTAADAGQILKRLERRVKENPRDIAAHLEHQMLLFLMDQQVPNLASIATLPQEDRELVTAVLDGISNLRATLRRDANLLIAEKIRPVVELSDRLRTSAELMISTINLCSQVDGFGRYIPMDPRFIAGRESQTIVYCEIENFTSQFNKQQWETNLSMELSLFSEAGQQVFLEQPVQIVDTSRSRRHDFFLRKIAKIPSNLPVGRYVMKVTIVDTQSNRVAETSLPVQVVAQ